MLAGQSINSQLGHSNVLMPEKTLPFSRQHGCSINRETLRNLIASRSPSLRVMRLAVPLQAYMSMRPGDLGCLCGGVQLRRALGSSRILQAREGSN